MIIKINGLLGKYNNIIDMSNHTIIFIGQNGIGKTTTLKILKCILEKDFINICKYKFDNIVFVENDKEYIFNYNDFIIPLDLIIKNECKNFFVDENLER